MVLIYSRPKKLNHVDTIRYEIDMLRYALGRLTEGLVERDAWVHLEAFLLHYRNLIEFLGKDRVSETDLHITNLWQLSSMPTPAQVNELHAAGKLLLKRYEPKDDQGRGRISQYLQHCTTKRIDAKDWEVSTMLDDIEPLLGEIEKHLGLTTIILPPVPAVPMLGRLSASTTVGTFTAATTVSSEMPIKNPPKDFE